MGDIESVIQQISIWALPVLFAITLHEAAHAYAARRYGDSTAYMLGRMTLNPLKHIDPIGTVLLPLLSVTLGGFIFGWAKPVPVNFGALRKPREHGRLVAAAGPAANLLMIVLWVLLLKLAASLSSTYSEPLALMSRAGIQINITLMLLNLLPILPLDGGRIMESLLPRSLAFQYSRLEPYGMWILLGLMFTGLLGVILRPFYGMVFGVIRMFL
ncbi:site-2 protease family protein [Neisseriaceae bacterium TC5R-5]|nr:site-2 protease family protein [Neisseriaceae bacterium TC5R-5]